MFSVYVVWPSVLSLNSVAYDPGVANEGMSCQGKTSWLKSSVQTL